LVGGYKLGVELDSVLVEEYQLDLVLDVESLLVLALGVAYVVSGLVLGVESLLDLVLVVEFGELGLVLAEEFL
jgi:hypothetical protein